MSIEMGGFPAVPAHIFRSMANQYKEQGNIKRYLECMQDAAEAEKSSERTYKYFNKLKNRKEENIQSISHVQKNNSLINHKWKLYTSITIIILIALSAIIFGLEYLGLLYR